MGTRPVIALNSSQVKDLRRQRPRWCEREAKKVLLVVLLPSKLPSPLRDPLFASGTPLLFPRNFHSAGRPPRPNLNEPHFFPHGIPRLLAKTHISPTDPSSLQELPSSHVSLVSSRNPFSIFKEPQFFLHRTSISSRTPQLPKGAQTPPGSPHSSPH